MDKLGLGSGQNPHAANHQIEKSKRKKSLINNTWKGGSGGGDVPEFFILFFSLLFFIFLFFYFLWAFLSLVWYGLGGVGGYY